MENLINMMQPNAPWIFESPDGGKTVYQRQAGDSKRIKIKDTMTNKESGPDSDDTASDNIFDIINNADNNTKSNNIWIYKTDLNHAKVRHALGPDVIQELEKLLEQEHGEQE